MILKKLIKKVYRILLAMLQINWFGFFRLINNDAKYVVFLSIRKLWMIKGENFIWDIGYIRALIKKNIKFSIKLKADVFDKIVIWSPNKYWDQWKFLNYTNTLNLISRQLEIQRNVVYPNASEIKLLENKKYMYKMFIQLKINHPKTYILENVSEIEKVDLSFPLLIKGEHSSGSREIYKINSKKEFYMFFNNSNFFKTNKVIIIQKLLNIHRDLRVIIVGSHIVLSFWRINKSKEWKPTATKYGSSVEFNNFPLGWKNYILDNFKKLNVTMGAFDVAWDNDDFSTEPYFLEFSPRFSPNPIVYLSNKNYSYGEYKKKLKIFNSFESNQNKIIFDIANDFISNILKESGEYE